MKLNPPRNHISPAADQATVQPARPGPSTRTTFNALPQEISEQFFPSLDQESRQSFGTVNKALQEIFRQRVRRLVVPGEQLTRSIADAIRKFQRVEQIKITGHLNKDQLGDLPNHLPGVTHLDLKDCEIDKETLVPYSLEALIARTPNLAVLNLSGCYFLQDYDIISLAEHCPELTSLNLNGCTEITDDGISALAKGCRKLTSLDLSGGYDDLTDEAITALANNCPDLTSLVLGDCDLITDTAIAALAQNCKKLTALDLSDCTKLTDQAVRSLAQADINLTSLTLTGLKIPEDAIAALKQRHPDTKIIRNTPPETQ